MAKQQQYENQYDQYDQIPMPQGGNQRNNQNYQGGNQRNNPNYQQNQKGNYQDKPKFTPPAVKAKPNDPLYQMLFRFKPEGYDEIFYIPSTTYFIQGQGVVDGRAGVRKSNAKGYAMYDADGSLFFVHENDSEYAFIHERVQEWNEVWNTLLRIADESQEPAARRRNRRGARGSNTKQTITTPWVTGWLKWGMLAMLLLTVLIFIATRS